MVIVLGVCPTSQAQQTYTLGAVHPFTGRFAFAGIHGQDAMKDVVDMTNEAGGINGKKLLYFWKDGEYKDDVGIAALKAFIPSTNPQLMWGQSTGMTKALAPEIKDRYKVLYSAYTFADEAANPKENPYLFIPGPTYSEQFAVLLITSPNKNPGPTWPSFTAIPSSAGSPFPSAGNFPRSWA